MRAIRPNSRRGSPMLLVVGSLLVLLIGGLGTVGTLWAIGVLPPLWAAVRPVRVLIPTNTRVIPAYTTIAREDLIDVEARSLKFLEVIPEQTIGMSLVALSPAGERVDSRVKATQVTGGQVVFVTHDGAEIPQSRVVELGGAIVNMNDIIGRVVVRDKQPGYGFKEENFLPKGTRPGIAGGIPPGMQALTLPADKLIGVHGLRAGDHIDLIATIPQESLNRFGGSDASRLPGASLVVSSSSGKAKTAGEARLVVQDGVLVTPVSIRAAPMKSSSLTQGTQVRNVPVQEVVIAVHRDDVPLVSEALALQVELTAVAHSGRPDAPMSDGPPPGKIAVPVSARPITSLAQVQHDDLFHPQTRRQKFVYMTAAEVEQNRVLTNVSEILGRVASRDFLPGEFITADDLLPRGTRPGLAGGIPPGKRAYVVEAEKLAGAFALAQGDHFDLVASIPIDLTKASGPQVFASSEPSSVLSQFQKQAEIRVIAQDAVVVAPAKSLAGASAGSGAKPAVPEIVIALDPREVPELTKALATSVQLTAIARSSQRGQQHRNDPENSDPLAPAGPKADDVTPGLNPLEGVRALETIVGGKRETVIFVGGGDAGRTIVNRPAMDVPPSGLSDQTEK